MKLFKFIMALSLAVISATSYSGTKSGNFPVINHSDKTIVIAVGDYFPVEYTLLPHSVRSIFVSTNNQRIEIRKVS